MRMSRRGGKGSLLELQRILEAEAAGRFLEPLADSASGPGAGQDGGGADGGGVGVMTPDQLEATTKKDSAPHRSEVCSPPDKTICRAYIIENHACHHACFLLPSPPIPCHCPFSPLLLIPTSLHPHLSFLAPPCSSPAPVSQSSAAPLSLSSGHNIEPAAPQTPLIGTAACPLLRPKHPARAGGKSSSASNGRRPTQEGHGMECGHAVELARCERPRHSFADRPKHCSSSSSRRTSGICPWEYRKQQQLQLQQQLQQQG
jgi:hypothetical protein